MENELLWELVEVLEDEIIKLTCMLRTHDAELARLYELLNLNREY